MLVLSRRVGERIVIDNRIVIEVLSVKGNRVRLGVQSPPGVTILRDELLLHDKINTPHITPAAHEATPAPQEYAEVP
jgi:carbon storage regulator